jgi:hypothetical protein
MEIQRNSANREKYERNPRFIGCRMGALNGYHLRFSRALRVEFLISLE